MTQKRAKAIWYVVCEDYRRGPFATKEAADNALASIEAKSDCPLKHKVVKEWV